MPTPLTPKNNKLRLQNKVYKARYGNITIKENGDFYRAARGRCAKRIKILRNIIFVIPNFQLIIF